MLQAPPPPPPPPPLRTAIAAFVYFSGHTPLHKSRFKEHLAFPEEDDDDDGGDGSGGGAVFLTTPAWSCSEFAQSRFTPNSRTRFDGADGGSACPAVMRTGTDSRTTAG